MNWNSKKQYVGAVYPHRGSCTGGAALAAARARARARPCPTAPRAAPPRRVRTPGTSASSAARTQRAYPTDNPRPALYLTAETYISIVELVSMIYLHTYTNDFVDRNYRAPHMVVLTSLNYTHAPGFIWEYHLRSNLHNMVSLGDLSELLKSIIYLFFKTG